MHFAITDAFFPPLFYLICFVLFLKIGGGWLLQNSDDLTGPEVSYKVVTKKVPSVAEIEDARFAWNCCKHVKSNAIAIAKVHIISPENYLIWPPLLLHFESLISPFL